MRHFRYITYNLVCVGCVCGGVVGVCMGGVVVCVEVWGVGGL